MAEVGDDGLRSHVAHVLRQVWDPIGLGDQLPEDEYDSYVPGLVALTRDTAVIEDAIVIHLERIEVEEMCMSLAPAKRTRTARALLGLRYALNSGAGRLVHQRVSPDGLRCLWIVETRGGPYAYERGVLRHEDDENGRWSWWAGAGLGQSGLFDTAEAAEREARSLPGWLRESDRSASAPWAEPEGDTGDWRALEPRERAVLDRLLAVDFPGRNELAVQAGTALVQQIDREGSLRFRADGPRAEVRGRVPVEGCYHDDGTGPGPWRPAVNILLHVVDGRLHELEIYKDDGSTILIDPFGIPLAQIEVWPS